MSLEDLYNGKTAKLAITRNVMKGEPRKFSTCRGQGVVIQMRQIGPGMVQQLQARCPDCSGGYKVTMKKACDVEYRALPKEWLDSLLGRVDGEKQEQQFFLRRSTGFASAFLSILRADSSRSRLERLDYALNRLLQSASENKNFLSY